MASVEIYRAKVEELMAKADISTVSAKRIRREIEALTNTNLSDVKREFDDMVLEIYDRFAENPPQGRPQQTGAAPPPSSFGFGIALPPTSYVAPPPPVPKPAPKVASKPAPKPASKPASKPDQTSASAVKAKAVTTKPTKRTNSKDSADSESDDSDSNSESEEISDDGAPPTKKAKKSSSTTAASSKKTKEKKTKPKAKAKAKTTKKSTKSDKESKPRDTSNNPFFQPLILSDPLSELIGHKGTVGTSGKVEMPRCTVVKYLWEHIKENDLKDKTAKQTINCDAKMKKIFGGDSVGMFEMNRMLTHHLTKPDQASAKASAPPPPPQQQQQQHHNQHHHHYQQQPYAAVESSQRPAPPMPASVHAPVHAPSSTSASAPLGSHMNSIMGSNQAPIRTMNTASAIPDWM